MSLSDLAIRHATPKQKPFKLSDTEGLFLDVRPTGKKIWRLKYYFLGNERLYTIGNYPSINLVKAREKRDELKSVIAEGKNPSEIKAEQKRLVIFHNAQTFQIVAEEWHNRKLDTWTKAYGRTILYRLQMNVFPCFGHKRISTITVQDIIHCLHKIEDRNAYDLTKRVLHIIGQVLRYAVITGRAERDVTPDLRGALKRHKSGHYACIFPEEIPDFLKALNSNNARLYLQTVLAIRLLMLTFVRTKELIEATWDEFDFDRKIWTIPPERMKMRRQHEVPLSRQVIEILQDLKNMFPTRQYILPSIINAKKPISNNTILKALESMGYKGRMTGHGFRALAMSTIKENFDYRHEVIDRQLAHLPSNKVDQAYDRAQFMPQRTQMMQDWADFVDKQSQYY